MEEGRFIISDKELAKCVDYTNLSMNATQADISSLFNTALERGYGAVCVRPENVDTIWSMFGHMRDRGVVKVASVVCFPVAKVSGDNVKAIAISLDQQLREVYGSKMRLAQAKARQTRDAIRRGADEIDMVQDFMALKSGDYAAVEDDIGGVVSAAGRVPVKVILETYLLSKDEIARACHIAQCMGACFVKTSTGFTAGGATAEDVRLMAQNTYALVGIKASGGVKDIEKARVLYEASQVAGHCEFRIGTSADLFKP